MVSVTPGVMPNTTSSLLFRLLKNRLSLYSTDSVSEGVTVIHPWWAGGLNRSGPTKMRGVSVTGVPVRSRSSGTRGGSGAASAGGGTSGCSSVVGAGGRGPVGDTGDPGGVPGVVGTGGGDGSCGGAWAAEVATKTSMDSDAVQPAIHEPGRMSK